MDRGERPLRPGVSAAIRPGPATRLSLAMIRVLVSASRPMSNDPSAHLQQTGDAAPLAWLAADAPAALPGDPELRSWLEDAGSLTARLRRACYSGFRLELLGETLEAAPQDAAALLDLCEGFRARRVRMYCGERLCVCATTLIPPATLAGEAWLSALGDRPLG